MGLSPDVTRNLSPKRKNGCPENENGACGFRRQSGGTPSFCGEKDGMCYANSTVARHCTGSSLYWLRNVRDVKPQ